MMTRGVAESGKRGTSVAVDKTEAFVPVRLAQLLPSPPGFSSGALMAAIMLIGSPQRDVKVVSPM